MNELLESALDAHGGLARWRQLTSLTVTLSLGGELLADVHRGSEVADVIVYVDTRIQVAMVGPFDAPDRVCVLTPDRVAIESASGELVSERHNPRSTFRDQRILTPGDALQLGYFVASWLWTAITIPFLLAEPGFDVAELEPWLEDGETWRRLQAIFPQRIASHGGNQLFYFGPDGLLRRHDYTIEMLDDLPAAEYTDEHQVFGGISFPTLRRMVGRASDGTSAPEPALVTGDVASVIGYHEFRFRSPRSWSG